MIEIVEFELLTKIKYDETNPSHKAVVELMAKENKNREGNEGLTNISISGISEAYINGYSNRIMSILGAIKKRVSFL